MTDWIETYRGSVPPWECDITEHFTIGFYFDRIGQAELNLAEKLGLSETLRGGGFARRYVTRFARELRAGAGLHIDSAPIGVDDGLRLGHKVQDSASDETVTWVDSTWEIEADAGLHGKLAAWDCPPLEKRPEPKSADGFFPTGGGRVRPGDIDENGRYALASYVHRFTDSSLQLSSAIGMSAAYLAANRRGFSTFEVAMRIAGPLVLGEPFTVATGITHLGNSSMRFVHVLRKARTGEEVARLGQYGVNLDLDARRPAGWPAECRARAQALVVPAE